MDPAGNKIEPWKLRKGDRYRFTLRAYALRALTLCRFTLDLGLFTLALFAVAAVL
jgi:hypothetical protein